MSDTDPLFASNLHAFVAGMLLGELDVKGVQCRPLMEGNDYTPQIKIIVPGLSEPVIITVEPPTI